MRRAAARGLLAAVAFAGIGAVAVAQEDTLPQLYLRGQPVYVRGQLLGESARVVGIEQGDNGFRYRTPALERAAKLAARVPRGELYRKRMAMYSPAATTLPGLGSRPPVLPRGEPMRRPTPSQARPPAAPREDPAGSSWPWVLALAVGAGAVWLLRRLRFAHRA